MTFNKDHSGIPQFSFGNSERKIPVLGKKPHAYTQAN